VDLKDVPKGVWIGLGLLVVVIALVARSNAASSSTLNGGSTLLPPPPADPNIEATNQAAIAARTSAFGDLASGIFGLQAAEVGGARDTNIAAIAAGTQDAQSFMDNQTAQHLSDNQTTQGLAQIAGDVTMAGYQRDVAFNTNSTTAQVAGIDAATTQYVADSTNAAQSAQAQIAADAAANLAAQATAVNADNNRTTLGVAQVQATTQRQNATTQAATASTGIFGAVAAAIPWFLSIL
jgi:hypothetical protein